MHIHIIAPRPHFSPSGDLTWPTKDMAVAGRTVVNVASASLAHVAALVPPDFRVTLCEEELDPVDFDTTAEVIGITANVAQAQRGLAIAGVFRARGKTVIMGGPHVSLAPHLFAEAADAIVVGELESVAEQLFADLRGNTLRPRYDGEKADLTRSPAPRWELYPNDRAIAGVVQTSRGCPFNCNFCDVIQYLGRTFRYKSDAQVLAEIQTLYDLGYRNINLSDDNFTAHRARARTLLGGIARWNAARHDDPVTFSTQMSIDMAKDQKLLSACNAAGLRNVFVGLETSSAASLAESEKWHNLRVNMHDECQRMVAAGIMIHGGLMVGFDSDDLGSFERQFQFAMSLPVVLYTISVRVAPVGTPLYAQMERDGRLVMGEIETQFPGGSVMSNIIPAQMTREQLAEGAIWLYAELLRPDNMLRRLAAMAGRLAPAPWSAAGMVRKRHEGSPVAAAHQALFARFGRDRAMRRVMEGVVDLGARYPLVKDDIVASFIYYLSQYERQQAALAARVA